MKNVPDNICGSAKTFRFGKTRWHLLRLLALPPLAGVLFYNTPLRVFTLPIMLLLYIVVVVPGLLTIRMGCGQERQNEKNQRYTFLHGKPQWRTSAVLILVFLVVWIWVALFYP